MWLLAIGGLLLYAGFTFHLCLLALGYRYQLDYGEGLVLHHALRLAQGQSIYKNLDSFPYIFSNYPPLFPALVSPLIAVTGASFLPGRVVAVAAAIGLTVALYALVRRAGGGRLVGGVAALAFVGSPYIYHWAPLFRIDLPALLLTTLGILALASGTSARRLWLAALLFVLAIYTKQSYVAAPLAAVVYLLFSNRRAARTLMAWLLVLGLLPFLALEVATGRAFSFGLFAANVNPFSLPLLLEQVQDFIITFAVLIVLALMAATRILWVHTPLHPRFSLLDCYLVAAVATVFLAGKVGAWENYFFEALFMICVYAGLGLGRLLQYRREQALLVVPVLLVMQLALMWHDPRLGLRVVQEGNAANRTLAPLITRQQGMILSEDVGLLLVNGQEVPYFSFQYAQLARVGRWDQRWEIENLRNGRFALVILEKGTRENPERYWRFTREVLSAIDAAYGLVAEIGKYRLYAPQPLQRDMNVLFGDQMALRGYRLDTPPVAHNGITIPATTAQLPHLNPYPSRVRLSLLWQARRSMAVGYKVFVHLEDASGMRHSQSDGFPFFGLYPTTRWQTEEMVRDYLDLDLPPGLTPGRYVLRVGLYDPTTNKRLARADGSDSLLLAALPIGLDAQAREPHHTARSEFANGIALLGYDLTATQIRAGQPLSVTLYWRTDRYIDTDLTAFVHLTHEGGPPLAQVDQQPHQGAYPTSIWNPGEEIADIYILAVPASLGPGSYRLLVGLYHQADGTRVPLATGGDSIHLADVQVTAP